MKRSFLLAGITIISFGLLLQSSCKEDDPPDTPIPEPDFEEVVIPDLKVSLNKVYFADPSKGWIIGDSGVILRSLDSGNTWTQLKYGSENLLDFHYFNDKNMWIVGENGTILFSADTGSSWTNQASPTYADLKGIHIVENQQGWIVGTDDENNAVILHTENGGHLGGGWQWQFPPENTLGLNDVFFTDANNGYACGYGGAIVQTFDGGEKWEFGNNVSNETLNSISFPNKNEGFMVGNRGTFVNTNDAGETWYHAYEISIFDLYEVQYITDKLAWCCGHNSDVFITTDGGVYWERNGVSIPSTLKSIHFSDEDHGWIVGHVKNETDPIIYKYIGNN